MNAQETWADSHLPGDFLAFIEELARSETEMRVLLYGLTNAEINWQAEPGETWSIAQCLDHVAKMNNLLTGAMRTAVRRGRPGKKRPRTKLQTSWFERYLIESMDAPPRQKFRASPTVLAARFLRGEEVLLSFCRSHQELRLLIEECTQMDVNRIRFRVPFIWCLRMRVSAGVLFLTAHQRRHLWQAKQVRWQIEIRASLDASWR
jgi:DinB superfamily